MRLNEIKIAKVPPAILGQVSLMIGQHCQPFLDEVGGDLHNYRLWRGLKNAPKDFITTVKCPVGRFPKDTHTEIHYAADRYFLRKFGVKYRSNSFFTTGSQVTASEYGSSVWTPGGEVVVIPIGNFTWCWSSMLSDFYQGTEEAIEWPDDLGEDPDAFEVEAYFDKAVGELCDRMKYKTTDLKRAIASNHEIMLHCKTAYFLNVDIANHLAEIGEMLQSGIL